MNSLTYEKIVFKEIPKLNGYYASSCENIFHSNIIQCCKGKRNKAGGYRWKYEE